MGILMDIMKCKGAMTLATLKIPIFVHDLKCWEIKLIRINT